VVSRLFVTLDFFDNRIVRAASRLAQAPDKKSYD
jgi:hypothetical protein